MARLPSTRAEPYIPVVALESLENTMPSVSPTSDIACPIFRTDRASSPAIEVASMKKATKGSFSASSTQCFIG